MFDLIVHAYSTGLIWCNTAQEQMAVIRDAIENGWDYEIPTAHHYNTIPSESRHSSIHWLAV